MLVGAYGRRSLCENALFCQSKKRQPIQGGDPVALTHFTEGRTLKAAASPDGQWIAVVRRIGQKEGLWLIPGKGEPRLLVEFRTGGINSLSWSEDSKNVLFEYGTAGKDIVLLSDYR